MVASGCRCTAVSALSDFQTREPRVCVTDTVHSSEFRELVNAGDSVKTVCELMC